MIRTTLALLIYASLACGQPWQWELVDPDWRNPTGFPSQPVFVLDVDGDHVDEVLGTSGQDWTISALDLNVSPVLRWNTVATSGLSASDAILVDAVDLDANLGQELIVGSTSGFACYSYNVAEHTWTLRDDLAAQLPPPGLNPFTHGGATLIADFDGDALLEVVFLGGINQDSLGRFERDENGTWQLMEELGFAYSFGWYADNCQSGDFDNDGDVDIGVLTGIPADPSNLMTTIIENVDGVFVPPGENYMPVALSTTLGGDLDGDGQWEGLTISFDRIGLYLTETSDGSPGYVDTDATLDLSGFQGTLLGTMRHNWNDLFVGFESLVYYIFPGGSVFYTTAYTPNGWVDLATGFYHWYASECKYGVMGDFDADGKRDILAINLQTWATHVNWKLYRNTGNDSSDHFSSAPLSLARFTNNPDTTYSWPVLAQVNDDPTLELVVLARRTGESNQIQFYSTSGSFADSSMALLPELNNGLPPVASELYATDLDGDGFDELIIRSDIRRPYFRRNGQWETYEDIFPLLSSPIRGFADWDSNGTIDIFTDSGIYLNLSPSAADGDRVVTPASFSLSAYPNPFNAQTTIAFDLPREGAVSLRLFDVLGREVETLLDERMLAGTHILNYSASALPSGVYFIRFMSNEINATHKLLLLK